MYVNISTYQVVDINTYVFKYITYQQPGTLNLANDCCI